MKIWTPRKELEFVVNDRILEQVLGSGFTPCGESYCSESYELIVPLSDIEPILRSIGSGGFRDDQSVINILVGFREKSIIPPIEVSDRKTTQGYRFRLKDGFHRYYLSIAAGFSTVPVVIRNFELADLDEV